MPAQNLNRTTEEGIYSHIYNKGIENRIIFNDEKDYAVFLDFLKDYLTAPKDPDSIKKSFQVNGRVFRGTPHQPKNYFQKVELIAYSLMPDHFHLLLHQVTKGSLENFIRSLCTRYSIYFNKKYQHTGAVFEGPYKSIQIKDEQHLMYLSRYLHHAGIYSSYADYLGIRVTSWIKPAVVLSFFNKGEGNLDPEGIAGSAYKDYVDNYQPDEKEKELVESITFENETQHLERRVLTRNDESHPLEPAESSEKIHLDQDLMPHQRIPELLATTTVFLLLLAIGITNIMLSNTKGSAPSILGITNIMLSKTKSPEPTSSPSVTKKIESEEIKLKILLAIKINDGASSVNIRQKPTTDSEKIGMARDGDTFEFLSLESGWYEVKLTDGSTGFISAKYIVEGVNN